MRTRVDEHGIIGTRPKLDLGPLFASVPEPPTASQTPPAHIGAGDEAPARREQVGRMPRPGRISDALEHHRKTHEREIAKIAPELRELARLRGRDGVNCTHTRALAVRMGVITGGETARELSWFSAVPVHAGLISAGLDGTWTGQGNRPTKYLHPVFARKEGAA